MKILEQPKLSAILTQFNFDQKVSYEKCIQFEPDCFIYIFSTQDDKKYALICRDLIQDDLEMEKRIFQKELDIEIMQNIATKLSNDYWLEVPDIEPYKYYFSLVELRTAASK